MISAVVLSKNEEDNIVDCVKSLSFCNEIIIVDDYSSDRTIEVVKKLRNPKTVIIQRSLDKDFSSQRNFGLSKTKGDWALFVDADERISDALAFEISNAVHQLTDQELSKFSGFYIKRNDYMWGKQLKFGETGGIRLLRLAKKDAGEWEGKVHEKWKVKGNIGTLKNPLIHFPHKTLQDFLKEINFYTSIRANELSKKNRTSSFLSILVYPVGKFLINYIVRRGFLDGIDGLIIAIMMSFHSFLVRGKLWLLGRYDE